MSYPILRVDLEKIKKNGEVLIKEAAKRGVSLWAVSKGISAYPEIAAAYKEAGFKVIADSRIANIRKMKEAGVDISGHRSKNVAELLDVPFDFVITVCGDADERCPFFPGNARIIHRGFDDPPKLAPGKETEEEKMDCYRRVRDEIRAFLEDLPGFLENLPE